jgi:hypothetical protein
MTHLDPVRQAKGQLAKPGLGPGHVGAPAWHNELRHTLPFLPDRPRPSHALPGRLRGRAKPRFGFDLGFGFGFGQNPCSAGTFNNSPQFQLRGLAIKPQSPGGTTGYPAAPRMRTFNRQRALRAALSPIIQLSINPPALSRYVKDQFIYNSFVQYNSEHHPFMLPGAIIVNSFPLAVHHLKCLKIRSSTLLGRVS